MPKKKKAVKPNKAYELIRCKRKHDYRILAFDPGSRNFGISCVGVKNDKIDVVANSILTLPINSLVDGYNTKREAFAAEIKLWLDTFGPDLIIAERFQTRGNMGPLIEIISDMNAVIGMVARSLQYKRITAATWKNSFHRRFTDVQLDDMYKACLTAAHPLDASLIGCYGLELALRKELIYDPDSIIKMVESSSCLDLRRPRK